MPIRRARRIGWDDKTRDEPLEIWGGFSLVPDTGKGTPEEARTVEAPSDVNSPLVETLKSFDQSDSELSTIRGIIEARAAKKQQELFDTFTPDGEWTATLIIEPDDKLILDLCGNQSFSLRRKQAGRKPPLSIFEGSFSYDATKRFLVLRSRTNTGTFEMRLKMVDAYRSHVARSGVVYVFQDDAKELYSLWRNV